MGKVFATFQRCFANLNRFNEAGFFGEIPAYGLLRERIHVTASAGGEFRKLVLLLQREMYFHDCQCRGAGAGLSTAAWAVWVYKRLPQTGEMDPTDKVIFATMMCEKCKHKSAPGFGDCSRSPPHRIGMLRGTPVRRGSDLTLSGHQFMTNQDLEALWNYHKATKHSYQSVRSNAHYLDWANYPLPFKIYSELEPIPLPREWPQTEGGAFAAIGGMGILGRFKSAEQPLPSGRGSVFVSDDAPAVSHASLNLTTLAAILYHTAGITRHRSRPGGEIYFRAAACTGALYEVELYLVCGQLTDLDAGVYHFNPLDFSLRKLRGGDYRGVLVRSTASEPSIEHALATIVCTGTYWRNAWKYQARTYRHFFWDNGTMLANLLGMAAAYGIPARLLMGFVDEEVNRLLSLDTEREVAISLVSLGQNSVGTAHNELPPAIEPLTFATVPTSKTEVDYPPMRSAHAASSLATAEEVTAWRGLGDQRDAQNRAATGRERSYQPPSQVDNSTVATIDLDPLPESGVPPQTIEQVILRRGSTRQFSRSPINFQQLSAILVSATQGILADFLDPTGAGLNDIYLIVNAVDALPSGSYFLRRDRKLELLKKGDFREAAGHLGLDQEIPADASVDLFFLADLHSILERFGNRGYRAAQMEAGIIGGKLYLASYAQKLGASGLTFYDDEVTDFFSPHAAGKSAIFLVAIGVPAKRRIPVL